MFGTFGSGGVLLVIIVALVMHRRGGGKLKPVKDHHVFYWGCAIGLFAAGAGTAFRQVGTVSTTITTAVNQQSATLGTIGPAAIALALIFVAFGSKPNFVKDLICGVAAPGILAAAGGLWVLPVTILGSILHSVV
ncbi:hypothetical protein GXW83_27395 [Streptacidiphilus sp. PB12-B1b]|uniref:hypothetical protein n=1 Tax=Streptacidiphilus sp. PB12-B1b TaxID=2705012 RepID=UPI0015FDD495|nr:hypothetical protein [Streptacidiphilus sp. PB12-B1b]QMU78871.1 hypothetical protein GXW83_27395 [Streptacidiphilus sp. PB12-B1b]